MRKVWIGLQHHIHSKLRIGLMFSIHRLGQNCCADLSCIILAMPTKVHCPQIMRKTMLIPSRWVLWKAPRWQFQTGCRCVRYQHSVTSINIDCINKEGLGSSGKRQGIKVTPVVCARSVCDIHIMGWGNLSGSCDYAEREWQTGGRLTGLELDSIQEVSWAGKLRWWVGIDLPPLTGHFGPQSKPAVSIF